MASIEMNGDFYLFIVPLKYLCVCYHNRYDVVLYRFRVIGWFIKFCPFFSFSLAHDGLAHPCGDYLFYIL